VDLGTPDEVYRRPANTYVATFLGTPRMHLMAAGVEALPDHEVRLYVGAQTLLVPATDFRTRPLAHFHSEQITVGIRSEAVRLVGAGRPAMLQCKVDHVEHMGHESVVYLWTDAATVPADDPDDGQEESPRKGGLFARLRARPTARRGRGGGEQSDDGRHQRPSSHLAARLAPYPGLRPGEPVGVDLDLSRVHFFDRYGRRIDVGL
jgi:multiple sugar transport system ATP-binding protein